LLADCEVAVGAVQFAVALSVNLRLSPREHIVGRDTADGALQPDRVVTAHTVGSAVLHLPATAASLAQCIRVSATCASVPASHYMPAFQLRIILVALEFALKQNSPADHRKGRECLSARLFTKIMSSSQPTLRRTMHTRIVGIVVLVCVITTLALAVEDVVTATHGTISKIDRAAKTIAIKTADGTEHVFYWAKDTSVHGLDATDMAAKDSWHGLKEGSEVVAHSTTRGAKDTAVEVDKVGDTGLKRTEGTVKEIDRGGKKLVIESADGTEHSFKLTTHAAADGAKDITAGTEKGTKVAVYSTERAGESVVHFFEKF